MTWKNRVMRDYRVKIHLGEMNKIIKKVMGFYPKLANSVKMPKFKNWDVYIEIILALEVVNSDNATTVAFCSIPRHTKGLDNISETDLFNFGRLVFYEKKDIHVIVHEANHMSFGVLRKLKKAGFKCDRSFSEELFNYFTNLISKEVELAYRVLNRRIRNGEA